MKNNKPIIVITTGDPAGIGPEIIAKSFAKRSSVLRECVPVVVGDFSSLEKYKGLIPASLKLSCFKPASFESTITGLGKGKISQNSVPVVDFGSKPRLDFLEYAVRLVLRFKGNASLVTAPLSKETMIKAGINFMGHTEYLARLTKTKEVAMMMVNDKINTLLATRHLPLKDVSGSLSKHLIVNQVKIAGVTLKKHFKVKSPEILICNFNPHQGEGGRIGTEEERIIKPAVAELKKSGFNVKGPVPADKAFLAASACVLVVCLYHDQAMLPLKIMYGNSLVNLTCGLPFIRTSPAHGVAYDIAGKNKADPWSMIEAINLAIKLT